MKLKFKNKLIKGLAISMAFSMLFTTNAFATPIDLANSEMDVKTDTLDKSIGTDYFADEENEWLNGTINEEVRVTVDLASQFTITIPKEIILDGETGQANYKVKAVGDIAGDQKLSIVPDSDFVLSEAGGKADVTATVTQADTEYAYTDLQNDGTEYDGFISATLTAGEWSGKFNFNIEFLASGKTLEDYTWAEIAAISEAGEAVNYFSVGDTKEMTLSNGETYNAEIIGFNHDNLADGTGTAGITFQFKEIMTTTHVMNTQNTNIGGWEASEMRSYVNNDVFDLLPAELQAEIKEVTKVSDVGNMNTTDTVETTDKLFLLSFEEVGFTSSDNSYFVAGQGTQYEIYSDNASRIKKHLSGSIAYWWIRSTSTSSSYGFFFVISNGSDGNYARDAYGVAPAFCI